MHHFSFEAIGTFWQIDVYSTLSKPDLLLSKIHTTIEAFDVSFSRFRNDSWVEKVHSNPGTHTMPKDAYELLVLYKDMNELTDGLFTPLIGATLEEAGYDKSYSLKGKPLTALPSFLEVVSFTKETLTTKQPVLLDFGAAGKGYLIDKVAKLIKDEGIREFSIDAGGDIVVLDKKLKIGLENPLNTSQVIGAIEITNESICGSSPNRRSWGTMHHIINPHTLAPVDTISATWVIANNAFVADALTTALFFIDPEVLLKKFEFEYLLLYKEGNALGTKRFTDNLF